MCLAKFKPGKPWIILIAVLGITYGFLTDKFMKTIRPTLLKDKYP